MKMRTDETVKNIIIRYGKNIYESSGMKKEMEFSQHRHVNCYEHSVSVAYLSVLIAIRLRLEVNMESLVRGALLHDYFLYDWRDREEEHKLHGFLHAGKALKNAMRDYELNRVERDIIVRHMFPLNITPPRYKESYIVSCADKISAVIEFFNGATTKRKVGAIIGKKIKA